MEEAKTLLKNGKVYGIIYIPESFSRDITKGVQTHVTIYCDMSGMLYYKAMLTANTNASLVMNKQIKIERSGNTTIRQDEVSTFPIAYEDISIFNPQNGFASFLIPAVLILIIQQTLLLGVGLSAGTARENNRFRDLIPMSRHYHGTLRIVLGKSLTYLMIYAVMATYMLCLVPKMFSLVQIAQAGTLAAFMFPYILACIFFAMTCSIFIHHREACMMIYVFTSVPLLFISGISWPGTAIPKFSGGGFVAVPFHFRHQRLCTHQQYGSHTDRCADRVPGIVDTNRCLFPYHLHRIPSSDYLKPQTCIRKIKRD